MIKIVCNTPDREDISRFWMELRESYVQNDEGLLRLREYLGRTLEKYCGTCKHMMIRQASFTYKLVLPRPDQEEPTMDLADEIFVQVLQDYGWFKEKAEKALRTVLVG